MKRGDDVSPRERNRFLIAAVVGAVVTALLVPPMVDNPVAYVLVGAACVVVVTFAFLTVLRRYLP
jgi:hypothetical protein